MSKIDEKLLSFEDTEAQDNDLENLNKLSKYKYFPKDRKELKELVYKLIEERGENADLNDIYTSNIIDMTGIFFGFNFNGDISKWDVSNVKGMGNMFNDCNFNGDISNWDVSNVTNMSAIFAYSKFNGDISKWNVSNVENMSDMFYRANFNGDISKWDVSKVKNMAYMFSFTKFNGDISDWNVFNVKDMRYMFYGSSFNGNISNWNVSNVKSMASIFDKSNFKGDISKWNINPICNTRDANFPKKKVNEKLLSFEDTETEDNDLENLNKVSEVAERKKWFEENCEYAVLLNLWDDKLLIPVRMNRQAVEKYKKEHPDIVVSTIWFGLYNYLINDNSYRFLCKDWYDYIENTLEYKDKSLPKTIDNLYPIRIFDNIRDKNNGNITESTINYINPKTGELLSPDVWFKTGNNFFRGTTAFVEIDIKEYPQFENYAGLINIAKDTVVKTLRLDINGKILPFKNEIKENKIFERLLSFEDTESEDKDLENLNELTKYNYYPKTRDELKDLVDKLRIERGNKADLNDIYTGDITDMVSLFAYSAFNGDISKWNVSNVEDMEGMFTNSDFNGDISKWDVHNVKDMSYMFYKSKFNRDISNWNVSNVKKMHSMFSSSKFNGDISKWDVSNVEDMMGIFAYSKFIGDISNWNINPECNIFRANFPVKPKIIQSMNEKLLSFEDTETKDNDLENLNELTKYNYFPKTREELVDIVDKLIEERGENADLNDIYTSNITSMSWIFYDSKFNGDISKWDVSNVKDMSYMFFRSDFNGDISNWDVSKVRDMSYIFDESNFKGDVSKWNINPKCNTRFANFPKKTVNEKLLSFEDVESEDNDLEHFNDISRTQENKDFLDKKGYVEHDPEYMWSAGRGLFPSYLTIFRKKFGFYVLVDKSRGYKILNDGLIFSFIYPFSPFGITTVKITGSREPQIYYLNQTQPKPFKYFLNSNIPTGFSGYNFIDNNGELIFPDIWFYDCYLDIEWFCRNMAHENYINDEDFYLRLQDFSDEQYYIFYPKTKKLIKVKRTDPLLKSQSWKH